MRSKLLLTERGIQAPVRLRCPARRISESMHFIVDTGSTRSFLGWEDALKLGLKVENLPMSGKPVLGFGGSAEARHPPEACYVYLDFEGTLQEVQMPEGILIYRPSKAKTKHRKVDAVRKHLGSRFLGAVPSQVCGRPEATGGLPRALANTGELLEGV